MGIAMKHPMPDRVKASFIILIFGHSDAISAERWSVANEPPRRVKVLCSVKDRRRLYCQRKFRVLPCCSLQDMLHEPRSK